MSKTPKLPTQWRYYQLLNDGELLHTLSAEELEIWCTLCDLYFADNVRVLAPRSFARAGGKPHRNYIIFPTTRG